MLETKEKIEQFKRDCRSMEYWAKLYVDCTERLEEITVKLQGVSSVRTDGIMIENAGDPYKNGKLYWMAQEDKVMKEREKCVDDMRRVNDKIAKIPNPNDQQMIRDLYIEKKNHEKVADHYHLNRQNMYRIADRILSKIV